MPRSMFSQNWYRVAGLRPRLRAHARIHRQRFRGDTWFVIQDDQTGRYHRLSPAANHMVCLMDGRRTVAEIWQATTTWLREEAEPPTQDETIRLLAQLHNADLLAGEAPPDLAELARRADDRRLRHLLTRLRNPMALRLPLIDPDAFLTATMPLARPIFSVIGLLVWLAVVGGGAVIAAVNWSGLTENLVDRVLLAENLLLVALVYPLIKAVHELGHGYAVKNWGGEVREMGFMFLVLIPVPYVDASAASAFPEKWRRAVVGGAGIMVELFIAGLAMMVWATAEPGLVRAAAFNAALIGGVSTLLFNGNPLLRFDGYYVLCDLLEIPNLGSRANRHIIYLVKRYAFGLSEEVSPATAPGEPFWFLVYGASAFFYRAAVMMGIALFIAKKLFFIGIGLALWAIASLILFPLLGGLRYLAESPQLRGRRGRAVGLTGTAAVGLLGLLFALPLPYATKAEGVIWLPQQAFVRAAAGGFVVDVAGTPNSKVAPGDTLFVLEDPTLGAQAQLHAAQRDEIRLRLGQMVVNDRVEERLLREQLQHAEASLALDRELIRGLTVSAGRDGRFVVMAAEDLPGSFVERGQLLGYVIAPGDPTIRVVVAQDAADLVLRRVRDVEVVLADDLDRHFRAKLVRAIPKAQFDLPSAALGTEGGGEIAVDPTSADRPKAIDRLFQFDVAVAIPAEAMRVGQRAWVRFDHGPEPIAFRLGRAIRQLFLSQFDV